MAQFFISTDSTADLFAQEIKDLDVGHLPLTVTIEKNGDFEMIPDAFIDQSQYVDFFNLLRKAVPAKTSMNNVDVHYKYFISLAEQGHNKVLHFTISYGLARTIEVAHEAIKMVQEKYPDFDCMVVESHTTTIGQGILVKEACKMRDNNATCEQAFAYVEELKHHIQHFVMVDDLHHLKRGGRVSGAAATIGTLANLKIILSFDREGKLAVIKKVMGGRKKAIKFMVQEFTKFHTSKDCHTTVVHTDNLEGATELANSLRKTYGVEAEVRIMGPTIGCHVGPNAIAYIFVSDELRPQ